MTGKKRAIFLLLCSIAVSTFLEAQSIRRITENAKRKVENKINQKVNKAIDDAVDGKPKSGEKGEKATGENGADGATATGEISAKKSEKATLSSYSRFDFVPGEKLVAEEDFSQDAIGDFPARWNTNGSAEVVTLSTIKGKWLKLDNVKGVSFIPDAFSRPLPENFTLEFDLVYNNWNKEYAFQRRLHFTLHEVPKPDHKIQYDGGGPGLVITFDGAMGEGHMDIVQTDKNGGNTQLRSKKEIPSINPDNNGKLFHVSIWRQKQRVRVYLDENKIFDLPRIIEPETKLNSFKFFAEFSDAGKPMFISNIRMAEGLPDTRNKLITEGKFVTSGITFDFQSATIKPESYGILKEIADAMKESSEMKVKIIGHTSNDGDANANLELSKQRAKAVKDALVSTFSIAEGRLTTDGKGGAQPAYPANTPEGKAANRRVEFVKQ